MEMPFLTILKHSANYSVCTFIESDRLTNTINLHNSGTNFARDFTFEAHEREK